MKRLEGKVIAITRPLERAQAAADIITREGGTALLAPTLELVMTRTESLMDLCQHAPELDWIIFTSRHHWNHCSITVLILNLN